MKDEGGFATPQLLLILAFGAAAFAGLTVFASASLRYEDRSVRRTEARQNLKDCLLPVIDALREDDTPNSDWLGDAVWDVVSSPPAGVTIFLKDVSSMINPNFVEISLFEKTDLGSQLLIGGGGEALRSFRAEKGLSINPNDFAAFFLPDAFRYLSVYGWANANVSDPSSLALLCRYLSGNEEQAGRLSALLAELAREEKPFTSHGFATAIAGSGEALAPVVNAEPLMNIHFIAPEILESLVSCPDFKVADPEAALSILMEGREARELTRDDIVGALAVKEDNLLLQYLGTTTWFWELSARSAAGRYVMILARLPTPRDEAEPSKAEFRIVERRAEP